MKTPLHFLFFALAFCFFSVTVNGTIVNGIPETSYDLSEPSSLFTTVEEYCIPQPTLPTSTIYGDFIDSFVTTGGETNISNTGSNYSAGGYGNFSASHSASQIQGEILSFSAVLGSSAQRGLRVWVDWNKDGVFSNDGSEIVYTAPNLLTGTHTGSFVIPNDVTAGNYRMRVFLKYDTLTPDPCNEDTGIYNWGEVEDYTLTVLEPPCSTPSDLTVSDLTVESVTISWTSTGSLFDVEWGVAGFTQGTGTQQTGITETSYDLSGLNENTSYDFYVRQDCNATSDGYSDWKKQTFTTAGYCIPQPTHPSSTIFGAFIDSFITTGGETNISNTGSNYSAGGYGNFSASHSASQIQGEILSFSAVPGSSSYSRGLRIWVDWNKDGVFSNDGSEIVYASPNLLGGTHTGSFVIPNDVAAGNYRMRVFLRENTLAPYPCNNNTSNNYGEVEDYTLTVSCSTPSDLTVSDLTVESVTISWTSTGSLFDIEWGVAGFTQGTGTQQTGITETSYALSGLNENTSYDFYVRQDCNVAWVGYSDWKKQTFTTAGYCIPQPTDPESADFGDFIDSFVTTGGETNISNTGSGYSAGGYGNFSAIHSASQSPGENLSFSVVPGSSGHRGLRVWVDWNKDGVFSNDGSEIVYTSPNLLGGTHTGSFVIPNDVVAGNYRMRVLLKYNALTPDSCNEHTSSNNYGEFEDYTLTVSSCPSPTALTVSDLTLDSATISWTSTGSLFDIEWGVAGFTQGTGTQQTGITETSYDLSGLEIDTSYDFYVRQDCNAASDGYSYWKKHTFTAEYCLPQPTDPESADFGDFIDSFITTGGETNISNTGSGYSAGGYGNFSASHSASQIQGEILSFSAVPGSSSYSRGLRIWVDWNKDGVFSNDGSEIVYASPNLLGGTHTGSFVIPNDVAAGNYRMRVFLKYNTLTPDPCTGDGYGEVEDYTLTVPCSSPSSLTVSYLTLDSATISWTSTGSLFDIEWGTAGFEQGNGTTVNGLTETSYSLSDLQPDTQYEFYARRDCTFSHYSEWEGPFSFKTLKVCPTGDFTFTTQQQIDDFGTDYAHCENISLNDVSISGDNITNLDGLSNLTNIEGSLFIQSNPQLTNLNGLSALTNIEWFLYIQSNPQLTNLNGLSDLTSIGVLFILSNPQLTNLNGLSALTSIRDYLLIQVNPQLVNLDGLNNLTNIGSDLHISYNSQLTNLDGLSTVTSIGGPLNISNNSALTDISGLQNIAPETIGGTYGLQITDNPLLSACNLSNFCTYLSNPSNLRTISGNAESCLNETAVTVWCTPCEAPENLEKEDLHSNTVTLVWQSEGNLFDLEWGTAGFTQGNGTAVNGITENSYSLSDLQPQTEYEFYVRRDCTFSHYSQWEGPFSFTTLIACPTGDFTFTTQQQIDDFGTDYAHCTNISLNNVMIQGYSQITNLDGLSALTSIGGDLQIYENSQLTNLDGLSALTSIGGGLNISNNSALIDISGLENIAPETIGTYGLYITGNSLLSVCNLPNFCEYLSNPAKPRTISGNAGSCYDEATVTVWCTPCEAPENLATEYLHSNTATLVWESEGNLFDLEWGTAGFTQGNGTMISGITETSYSLSDLQPQTEYEFYVRRDCTFSHYSEWEGSFSFTTLIACPTGDFVFTSQQQIDDFGTDYAHCENIALNNVTISGNNITNLNGLSNVTSIGGYLDIYYNSLLNNLDGLSALTNIGGYLYIEVNSQLTNLNGLSALTSIGGYLYIYYNSLLTNLDGLSNLTSIGGYLEIYNNSQLTNLDGLSTLTSIGGDLNISSNSQLTNLDGLNNLTSIEGYLLISNNSALIDISGLENITPETIGGTYGLYITYNPLLSVCNLPNFCEYLFNPAKPRTISSNAESCLNETTITNSCISCEAPEDLATEYLHSNTATLVWESEGNLFDLEWGTAGFTQGNGTAVNGITENSYSLSDLQPDTQYEFYVRRDCTFSHYSEWEGPFSFKTLKDCPTGDFTFTSQQQIDDFGTDYAHCENISLNSVSIGESNITNLEGLSNVTSIGGSLYISYNSQLTNLDGLSTLTSIGGHLVIYYNSQLANLDGLNNLTSIEGHLSIWENSQLTNLNGLSALTSIGGYLDISYNSQLTNLNGLNNLTSIGGDLFIDNNSQLTDISGLQHINPETIGGTDGLYIISNPLLSVCNLPNFCTYLSNPSNPRTIAGNAGDCISEQAIAAACQDNCTIGDFTFSTQAQIDDFGATYGYCTAIVLDNLTIGGSFNTPSDIHDLTPLQNISTVTGNVLIQYNPQLADFDGLVVTDIGGDFRISNNASLESLNGFSNLTGIGGEFYIGYNNSLQTISGFNNLTSIGGFVMYTGLAIDTFTALSSLETITGNFLVSYCTLTDFNSLGSLESVGGNFNINYTDIESLSGFSSLQSVGGDFSIGNSPMENFNGLSNLTSIGGSLYISNNSALIDISGLENIAPETIGGTDGLYISDNPLLWVCNLPNFCTYLSNPSNPRTIAGNAGSCYDEATVTVWCTPCEAPEDLATEYLHSNTATLVWQSDGSLFELEWGTAGFTQGNGTAVNGITETSYSLSGLQPDTQYEFYVRRDCTFSHYSEWEGPFSFKTLKFCPTGGITFTTQQQIDDFEDDYAHCTDINFSNITITIQGNDITNLDGLSSITGVYSLIINSNPLLTDLDGLINLTSVGNTLVVVQNPQLVDISGLQNIDAETIGALYIQNNSQLSVCNLPNICEYLSDPDNSSNIFGNAADCVSFQAILSKCYPCEEIPYNLNVINLTFNSATLEWEGEGNLYDLEWGQAGFTLGSGVFVNNIEATSHNLSLSPNTQYEFYVRTDCGGYSQSDWIGPYSFKTCPAGSITFTTQQQIDDFEDDYGHCINFSNITITIQGNDITNLDGLSSITGVNSLIINSNPLLTDLDGLINLTSVEMLVVVQNPQLVDMSGLQNVDAETIDALYIQNNSLLSVCNLPNICEYLSDPDNWSSIFGNAADCVSEQAVKDACFSGNCESYTIWNGAEWSNGEPDTDTKAIINGNLVVSLDLTACELEVTINGSLTIPANRSLTVKGQVINNSEADNFVVKSDGMLIQVDDVDNEGAITVERESSPMFRLDYTLWSSPVEGMLLKDFSDVSPSGGYGTLWNRVYTLGADAWNQVWATQADYLADTSNIFTEAKGYLYRAKNDWVARDSGNPAESDLGIFTGVPNNGNVTIATPLDFNAIGNPYPSPVDGDDLLGGGVNALYFWTNTNIPNESGTYVLNNWASYSTAGGTMASNGTQAPDGMIQPGQGFVVGTTEAATQITFTNTMRKTSNGQFFRQMNSERHRLWLNLSDEVVTYNQILVGYIENATQGEDIGIDAKMFAYEGNAIYSLIENIEEKYVIQGRALPFTTDDVVPLGFRAVNAGSFSISLNNFDGLFEEGNTIIYLKDHFNQSQHNLNNGAYTFLSEEGVFDNRFEVVYQTTMSVENPDRSNADWIVFKKDSGFHIQTYGFDMKEVSVYDLLGRKIYTSKVDGTIHQIPALGADGVYIVKITTTEDKILNKKVR